MTYYFFGAYDIRWDYTSATKPISYTYAQLYRTTGKMSATINTGISELRLTLGGSLNNAVATITINGNNYIISGITQAMNVYVINIPDTYGEFSIQIKNSSSLIYLKIYQIEWVGCSDPQA